jgi:hypothetical protein
MKTMKAFGAPPLANNPEMLLGLGNHALTRWMIGKRKNAKRPCWLQRSPTMKKGGSVSSASKRADGIAEKGKTRGRMV